MANRTIESPGVEIFETDLSQIATLPVGTKVFVTGFAKQGPSYEATYITSKDELESVFGTPENAAERYFYHSCKEVLNSPAVLMATRMPYGSADGVGYDGDYSMLVYPNDTQSYVQGLINATDMSFVTAIEGESELTGFEFSALSSATTLPAFTALPALSTLQSITASTPALSADIADFYGMYTIVYANEYSVAVGTPEFMVLQASAYDNLIAGQFDWDNYDVAGKDAAFFVINKGRTTINDIKEGYYVSVIDTTKADTAAYDCISGIYTIDENDAVTTSPMDSATLGLPLTGDTGSYSEMLETGYTYDISDASFDDALIVAVSKFRTSNQGSKGNKLYVGYTEKFIGSLDPDDVYRTDPVTREQGSFFIENKVNTKSTLINVMVNPLVKNKIWSGPGGTRIGDVLAIDQNAYPLGTYASVKDVQNSKTIGALPSKIERALSEVDNKETVDVDIVCEAGLGTVYSYVKTLGTAQFDDTVNIASYIDLLKDDESGDSSDIALYYKSVFNVFKNFVENVRKDCIYIADPVRGIFIQGADFKVRKKRTTDNTFGTNFYWPLKNLYSSGNSSYVCTAGNWVKAYNAQMDENVWLPFSGYWASIMAKMDSASQPWFAPAGLNRGIIDNIVDIAIEPRQKERDQLYKIGVNPITQFPGDGFVVYGQKTLQALPSAFDRINVRRLFLVLERATLKLCRYFVMEPNTTFTRTRLVNTLTPIFDIAVANQGIYSYLLVCDERNNGSSVIDNNELALSAYIRAVRTGEYILCNFIATRTDADFNELIG